MGLNCGQTGYNRYSRSCATTCRHWRRVQNDGKFHTHVCTLSPSLPSKHNNSHVGGPYTHRARTYHHVLNPPPPQPPKNNQKTHTHHTRARTRTRALMHTYTQTHVHTYTHASRMASRSTAQPQMNLVLASNDDGRCLCSYLRHNAFHFRPSRQIRPRVGLQSPATHTLVHMHVPAPNHATTLCKIQYLLVAIVSPPTSTNINCPSSPRAHVFVQAFATPIDPTHLYLFYHYCSQQLRGRLGLEPSTTSTRLACIHETEEPTNNNKHTRHYTCLSVKPPRPSTSTAPALQL